MITKDNIEALIKFGGLLVYEVSWFDELRWKTQVEIRTFNEERAIIIYKDLLNTGLKAKIETYLVHFHQK